MVKKILPFDMSDNSLQTGIESETLKTAVDNYFQVDSSIIFIRYLVVK